MAIPTNTLLPPKSPNLPVGQDEYSRQYQDQFANALRIYFNQLDNTLQTLLSNDPGGAYLRFPFGSFQDTTVQTAPANTAQVMRFDTTDLSNGVSIGSNTAVFTGTIDDGTPPGAGTVLTVATVISGTIYLGMTLTGGAISAGTKVVSQTSGTAGGVGVYVVSISQERTSLTITGTVASKLVVATAGIYNLQFRIQYQNVNVADKIASVWLRKNNTDVVGSSSFVTVPLGTQDALATGSYFLSLAADDYVEIWWSADSADIIVLSAVAGTGPTRPTTASVIATMTFVSALTA